eukprot:CAMPEP_0170567498 /NCGR_PEP_ID=MMETSP0211-20121228/80520_1 /TAXON_ID=311385 /ORGANISM="Pseudokeronopsis sp., Strain OXSARD2" /LENGTH=54 /DNA_ID=CAMNT_0010888971 /DNA_START=31 /DNA_END=195 /DNA_ORIENTATION=+
MVSLQQCQELLYSAFKEQFNEENEELEDREPQDLMKKMSFKEEIKEELKEEEEL